MNKKQLFRFEIEIEATFKVEKVKDTDYGKKRYLKQLIGEFVKDREAMRSYILSNFIDIYWSEPREELQPFLGDRVDSRAAILRLAKKCTPEVFQYFYDLFAARPVKRPVPGNRDEENLAAAGSAGGQDPDRLEMDEVRDMIRESEWVSRELNNRLCKFTPVHAAFGEAPEKKTRRVHE